MTKTENPAPATNALGDDQPRYTTKRLHDEIDKARAYGLEMAAQLIAANIIQDTSRGKVLSPRQEGNRDGLHYATEIRYLAAPVDAKDHAKWLPCPSCDGTGADVYDGSPHDCQVCHGRGQVAAAEGSTVDAKERKE